jgi:heat shock protein HspQ
MDDLPAPPVACARFGIGEVVRHRCSISAA